MSSSTDIIDCGDCSRDDLLLLLRQVLPRWSPSRTCSPSASPLSFSDPFADLNMEPRPIRSNDARVYPLVISNSLSSIGSYSPFDENKVTPSFMNITNTVPDLSATPESAEKLVCSKRGIDNIDQQDHGPPVSKRGRPDSKVPKAALSLEETTARFRPYQEEQWDAQLQKLIRYKEKHGHCCVPNAYPHDLVLARWVKRQRGQYTKLISGDSTTTMTKRRIQKLEAIGFVWHSHTTGWMKKFNELKAFKECIGHCNVPSHYPQNPSLASWVKCQRRQYKLYVTGETSTLTMERFQALESLGFEFVGRRNQNMGGLTIIDMPSEIF